MSRKFKFYDPQGVYFVSCATVEWVDVFTRPEYKEILVTSLNHCIEQKGLVIYGWVIMTNHIHLLIRTNQEPLENIMRDFKRHTSKRIIQAIKGNTQESRSKWMLWIFKHAGMTNSNNSNYQFWQQDNHPLIISNKIEFYNRLNYIHNNPVRAGFVDHSHEYKYSSAKDYSDLKGLVNISIER